MGYSSASAQGLFDIAQCLVHLAYFLMRPVFLVERYKRDLLLRLIWVNGFDCIGLRFAQGLLDFADKPLIQVQRWPYEL